MEHHPTSLTLVELDDDLIPLLRKKYTHPHIHIHHGDVLQFTPNQDTYSVIANIPYYITAPILEHFFFTVENKPAHMVILMQKEVGEKILGGTEKKPKESILSLMLGYACDRIEAITLVPRDAFYPVPKVDSIVLRFDLRRERDRTLETSLLHLWQQAFMHPRKTLLSNLRGSHYQTDQLTHHLQTLGYPDNVRAEAIYPEDWRHLLAVLTPPE